MYTIHYIKRLRKNNVLNRHCLENKNSEIISCGHIFLFEVCPGHVFTNTTQN